jgi:SNF2 family DNA or RNA helicase
LTLELYDWQNDDTERMARQVGSANGSEMGTGKTLVAIALMERWWEMHPKLPDLVVGPLNTFDGWLDKFSQMAPHVDVTVIDRKNRAAFSRALERKQGDVFLMHWDAIRLMPELRKMQFGSVVCDEAHRMANRKNQWTRAVKALHTQHKHAMSGTLSGDKPQNLWSTFNWLYPKYYKSYWRFFEQYVDYEIVYPAGFRKQIGVKNVHALRQEIDPWYVRHLKKEQCCANHPQGVMPWLPDKYYDTIWVDLAPAQRRVYEEMRKNMVAWLGEQGDSPLVAQVAVVQMVRLSQMALAMPHIVQVDHFRRDLGRNEIVDEVHLELPSTKAEAVLELLQDHPDKKFVVATSSKKMAYLLHEYLKTKKIGSWVLSGDTHDRTDMVRRWGESSDQVWIGVIKAMGEGIDGLQWYCDTMIFLDRDWSAFWNKQCEDRLHRDGQENAVQIIDIMARSAVDLGRHQKLELKWSWIRALLDGRVDQKTGRAA